MNEIERQYEIFLEYVYGRCVVSSKSATIRIFSLERELRSNHIDNHTIANILLKLQFDLDLLTILTFPRNIDINSLPILYQTVSADDEDDVFEIAINDKCLPWLEQKLARKSNNCIDESHYWIEYTENRIIVLNNVFVLSKPDFDSENDLVFSYIFKNPYKEITEREILEIVNKKEIKSFHKILDNLNFSGDIRKLFFDVSRTVIVFHNPVSKQRAEKLGLLQVRLKKQSES